MRARIRQTGELIEVISFDCQTTRGIHDTLSYIDSKGVEHEGEPLNYYWDIEQITDCDAAINWEQRKFEVAKGLLLTTYQDSRCNFGETPSQFITRLSVSAIHSADTFIAEYRRSLTYNG